MTKIPRSHPRYASLAIRELLVKGWRRGYVVPEGLIAHGRGEAFDYIIGETSIEPALQATRAAAAALLAADYPVISVNGNTAALVAKDVVELAEVCNAAIEVNLFHRSRARELSIRKVLMQSGARQVLGVDASARIPELQSERRRVDPQGILKADTVMVPLEDGDRTESLRKLGKRVISVDLNPFSRTSLTADIPIVDNITRVLPQMIKYVKELKGMGKEDLVGIVKQFNKERNLADVILYIGRRLHQLAEERLR